MRVNSFGVSRCIDTTMHTPVERGTAVEEKMAVTTYCMFGSHVRAR